MKKIDKNIFIIVILTIIGFGILFGAYGIFPFGTSTINIIDFDGGYIPVYYKLWDVLHFESPLLFDWNLGTGLNSLGSLIGNGMISPLCWIIGLFPRDSIPYSISFVYLSKMIFMSIVVYYAIGKIYPKTKSKYKVLFGLMYTFSSWTFMMSSNLLYLDAVAIFPILVYSLKLLLEKGRWELYTIILTITLLLSYYIAYLDLLFIISLCGSYLLIMKTDNKKEKCAKLVICTIISLLLSSFLVVPGFMFAKTSTRMADNTSSDGILYYFMDKSAYLFTMAIPLILSIKQFFVKKDVRRNAFFIILLLLLLIGIVIEPINALWHTGSHYSFPFRYAFQPTFILILISLYYINNNYKPKKITSIIRIIVPIVGIITFAMFFIVMRKELIDRNLFAYSIYNWPDYLALLTMFIILIVTFIFVLRNDKKKAFILTCVLFAITTLSFGYLYMEFSNSGSSSKIQKLRNSIELYNDGYNYVNDTSFSNDNFPYILKVPSIENRIHFISQGEMDLVKYLGYKYINTSLSSSRGSEFSNALLQNKYYLYNEKNNDSNYSFINSAKVNDKDVFYYKYNNNLNYVIPYNGNNYNERIDDPYENANNIYKALFDGANDIYKLTNVEYEYKDDTLYIYVPTGNYKFLFDVYLDDNVVYERGDDYTINGIDISGSNGRVDITAYTDTVFKITFKGELYSFTSYKTVFDELNNFINRHKIPNVSIETIGRKRVYNVPLEEDSSILIPINYFPDYDIKVNGETVDYRCNLYNMVSLDLKKGNNRIEIVYKQKWLFVGIVITCISSLVLMLLLKINKKHRFLNNKIILWVLFISGVLAFFGFIIYVYFISWIRMLV